MTRLEQLRPDHAGPVLAFEKQNRDYFARWVSDRGDAFFEDFATHFGARLAEQDAGQGAYFVLTEQEGSVVGRINLVIDGRDVADLGYRIAESATGRGLATRAVNDVCDIASSWPGLRRIDAVTSTTNVPSQRVLSKTGFVLTGPADPAALGGKPGHRFERVLE